MQQILSHTPLYVWAILAFLVYRGLAASRTREVAPRSLFIVPGMMLMVSLQHMVTSIGGVGALLGAWLAGVALTAVPFYRSASARLSAGASPGLVRVAGSWIPLAAMMSTFALKFAAGVALVIQPRAFQSPFAVMVLGTLLGLPSGYFLAQLARDLRQLGAAELPAAASISR